MDRNLDTVVEHYLMALAWADAPEDEPYLDLASEVRETARTECAEFLEQIETAGIDSSAWDDEHLGHDFWLTRQHHGVGFWDRGRGPVGEHLTALAQTHQERCVYIGDDGLLYAD